MGNLSAFLIFILRCLEKFVPLQSQKQSYKPKKKGSNYAVILQQSAKGHPRDPKGARKWYAILKSVGQVDEHEVAKLVSDETTLNPKEAEMAVYQLEKVMERLLLDGHTVQIGELGSFSLTIISEACHGEKEVTPDKIKKLNLRFRAGKGIKAALENAKFRPAEDMMSKKK